MATARAKVALLQAPPPPPARRAPLLAPTDYHPFSPAYFFHLLRCLRTLAGTREQPQIPPFGLSGREATSLPHLFAAIDTHLVPLSLTLLQNLSFATAVSESRILPIATYGHCTVCEEAVYPEPLYTLERLYRALTYIPLEEAAPLLLEIEQSYGICIPMNFDLDKIHLELVKRGPPQVFTPLVRDTLAWLKGETGSFFTDLCGSCLYLEDGYSIWEAAYHGDTFLSLETLCFQTLISEWAQAQQVLTNLESLQTYIATRRDGFQHLWHFLMDIHHRLKFTHVSQLPLPLSDICPEAP